MTYTYDADGNRNSLQIPGYSFTYDYSERNQLKNSNFMDDGNTVATFGYDLNGNVSFRDLDNSTYTDYAYDQLDRVTDVRHYLNGDDRTFEYGNDTDSNNCKWTKRDGGNGDVFGYDLADQVAAVKLDIPNPDTTSVGAQTVMYDANGNRTSFSPYGTTDTYTINNLNQYSSRNGINAAYDANGNLTTGVDGSTYTYDQQNRMLTATKDGLTYTFEYDGLNRQVSRTVNEVTSYIVWDGWDLVQEYRGAGTVTAAYLYGASGLVKNLVSNNYYYQDGSGSTSHLASSAGALLEWYRYDLQGTPIFYNAADVQITGSNFGIRRLFTGQQWYSELGLYDLRNRFYSPDIGRFLQPDPIGFGGDATNVPRSFKSTRSINATASPRLDLGDLRLDSQNVSPDPIEFGGGTNLYRYCRNNPLKWRDPSGLQFIIPDPKRINGMSNVQLMNYVGAGPLNDAWEDPAGLVIYAQRQLEAFEFGLELTLIALDMAADYYFLEVRGLFLDNPALDPNSEPDYDPQASDTGLGGGGGLGGFGGLGGGLDSLGNFGGFGSAFGGQWGSSSGLMDSNDLGQVHVGQSALDNWLGSSTGDYHIPIWGSGGK